MGSMRLGASAWWRRRDRRPWQHHTTAADVWHRAQRPQHLLCRLLLLLLVRRLCAHPGVPPDHDSSQSRSIASAAMCGLRLGRRRPASRGEQCCGSGGCVSVIPRRREQWREAKYHAPWIEQNMYAWPSVCTSCTDQLRRPGYFACGTTLCICEVGVQQAAHTSVVVQGGARLLVASLLAGQWCLVHSQDLCLV